MICNFLNKKVIGCYEGKKDSFVHSLIKWYLQHDLKLTAVYPLVEYEPGKQLSEVPKLKGNSL